MGKGKGEAISSSLSMMLRLLGEYQVGKRGSGIKHFGEDNKDIKRMGVGKKIKF